ncbi:MAG: tetratricopeptide repeat protein, partial [Campylobacterota bacterium]|nr:tetratricopeptide repeat protein [Campylobacterota bacterium]
MITTINLFAKNEQIQNSILDKPLIERYILDELKELRTSHQKLREDTTKQITQSELSTSDRAITYVTD